MRSSAPYFLLQAGDGIRSDLVTGVQTCALPICYQRTVELSHRRITAQTASIRSEIVKQPWRSISPERLRAAGYVAESGDYTRSEERRVGKECSTRCTANPQK